jgi:hypothetical protein
MKPEAIAATRKATALQLAFEAAKARPAKVPQKPGAMPTRKPPRFQQQTPEAVFEALLATIRVRERHGMLNLSLDSAALVTELGATDQRQLTLAFVKLGYTRIHRGTAGAVFFTLREKKQ